LDQNLEKVLVEKYPIIFKEYGGDIRKTCMGWGLSCGDGWFNLVYKLCNDIMQVIGTRNIDITALQVKEKFGGLRFYYSMQVENTILSKIDRLFYKVMVSLRLGRKYWVITNFRRKFIQTTDEKISSLINKAESDSYTICENCGKPGRVREGGWIRTLCDECDKED